MDSAGLSWDLLGAFLAVMRTGSLSGASRTLGVAQPTVRRQIETLEEVLGTVLFTRSQTGLTATEAAKATLPYAESMASVAEALVRSVSAPSAGEHTRVFRSSCPPPTPTKTSCAVTPMLRSGWRNLRREPWWQNVWAP